MAANMARIRFSIRIGGEFEAITGTFYDFDTEIGCIENWSGLLSEGPVSGDIIEQDWVNGALWQQGVKKTYSFDVPFTFKVVDPLNPNVVQGWYYGMPRLMSFRGPLLTLRREFVGSDGLLVSRQQAWGVLVTDLAVKVDIGRVLSSVAVFQNLSGEWIPVDLV